MHYKCTTNTIQMSYKCTINALINALQIPCKCLINAYKTKKLYEILYHIQYLNYIKKGEGP